jgi:hypothetical protein
VEGVVRYGLVLIDIFGKVIITVTVMNLLIFRVATSINYEEDHHDWLADVFGCES